MARTVIDIGSSPGDGTGDSLHAAGQKINDMTQELYDSIGGSGTSEVLATGASPIDIDPDVDVSTITMSDLKGPDVINLPRITDDARLGKVKTIYLLSDPGSAGESQLRTSSNYVQNCPDTIGSGWDIALAQNTAHVLRMIAQGDTAATSKWIVVEGGDIAMHGAEIRTGGGQLQTQGGTIILDDGDIFGASTVNGAYIGHDPGSEVLLPDLVQNTINSATAGSLSGATTSHKISLGTPRIGSFLEAVGINVNTVFAGGSISALTVTFKTSDDAQTFLGPVDLMTLGRSNKIVPVDDYTFDGVTDVVAEINSTGGNINDLTNGVFQWNYILQPLNNVG